MFWMKLSLENGVCLCSSLGFFPVKKERCCRHIPKIWTWMMTLFPFLVPQFILSLQAWFHSEFPPKQVWFLVLFTFFIATFAVSYILIITLSFCRLFAAVDDIFCLFQGHIGNIPLLKQQYGLSKTANEVIIVIEAYRTLRDRGPYPADQVMRDLNGKFAFILFDSSSKTTFIAAVSKFWN